MIDNEKKEIAVKHREDVIDTIQLRARERQVFYALLVMMFLTIAYENSEMLFAGIFSESFTAPVLGERLKIAVKPDMLKRLEKALNAVAKEYPQFWSHMQNQQKMLSECTSLAAEPAKADLVMGKVYELLGELNEFVSNPAVSNSKNLDVLNKELKYLTRILKLKFNNEFTLEFITFKTEQKAQDETSQRNLFEFKDRSY